MITIIIWIDIIIIRIGHVARSEKTIQKMTDGNSCNAFSLVFTIYNVIITSNFYGSEIGIVKTVKFGNHALIRLLKMITENPFNRTADHFRIDNIDNMIQVSVILS